MRNLLRRAMQDPNKFFIEMAYPDAKGRLVRRAIAPTRFVGSDRIVALDILQETDRQFYVSRMQNVSLLPMSAL